MRSKAKSVSERSFYILVATDTRNLSGSNTPVAEIADERLRQGLWPLYGGTRNRKSIKEADVIVVYLAGYGRNAQTINAEAVVSANSKVGRRRSTVDIENLLSNPPEFVLTFSKSRSSEPVNIKPLLDRLLFRTRSGRNWGVLFVGGFRKITAKDYETIVS